MTLRIIGTSEIVSGPVVPATSVDDADYTVRRNVLLVSSDNGVVFQLEGSRHDVTVAGTLVGGIGVLLGNDSTDRGNTLTVGADGDIFGSNLAVQMLGATGRLTNAGEIRSNAQGVVAIVATGGSMFIENSGVIAAMDAAVTTSGPDSSARISLVNTGTINGGTGHAYQGDAARDVVANRGLIIKDVLLGAGGDLFDNRGGQLKGGWIRGEEGDDVVRPGRGAERIDGGPGRDALSFWAGPGLRVDLLDPSANTGRAAGDLYRSIEDLRGSATGDDRLFGNGAANSLLGHGGDDVLAGRGGRDVLRGGAGLDRLDGGAGVDRLSGGAGADEFRFSRPGDGGDLVLDFQHGSDGGDRIVLDADAFAGLAGLTTIGAAQFASQTDAVARTESVRLIWDADDTRLWYDANGSALGGRSLIADLQSAAVLTLGDILLS